MNIGQKTFQTEQELWHAFLSSDKNAFAYLFEKYADAMYAYGRKMTLMQNWSKMLFRMCLSSSIITDKI